MWNAWAEIGFYIKQKWGASINKDDLSFRDEQPPYEFKNPFNKKNLNTNFIPITERMKIIQDLKNNTIPSQNEITKLLIDSQGIKK